MHKEEHENNFQQLLKLLEKMNIEVKYQRGIFKSGLVRYHEDQIFYLNKKSDAETRIKYIMAELKMIAVPKELLTEEILGLFETYGEDAA